MFVTIVTCNPYGGLRSSWSSPSGNTLCSVNPIEQFPSLSNMFCLIPRKSRILGIAMCMNFSRKLYACCFRSVTHIPTGIPSRSLKFDTASFAFLTIGFCPVISASVFSM